MKVRIQPYSSWSGGAKALGKRCGVLRATEMQVKKWGDFDVIINWGSSEEKFNGKYINKPEAVCRATDKLRSFRAFTEEGVPTVPWTSDRMVAGEWLAGGHTVVARTLCRGNSGRGIVLVDPDSGCGLPQAPLYTRYVKKVDEYRVHVFRGEVIDVQQKRKREDTPRDECDYRIRNHGNGFVFCRGDTEPPQILLDASVAAVHALGLDFGAVDVGWNDHHGLPYVYEVNTAPGLEGETLESYWKAFVNILPWLQSGMYAKRRAKNVQSISQ